MTSVSPFKYKQLLHATSSNGRIETSIPQLSKQQISSSPRYIDHLASTAIVTHLAPRRSITKFIAKAGSPPARCACASALRLTLGLRRQILLRNTPPVPQHLQRVPPGGRAPTPCRTHRPDGVHLRAPTTVPTTWGRPGAPRPTATTSAKSAWCVIPRAAR